MEQKSMKKRLVWKPKTTFQKGLYYLVHGFLILSTITAFWMLIAIFSLKGGWI